MKRSASGLPKASASAPTARERRRAENLFLIRDGVIYTPSLTSSILQGIIATPDHACAEHGFERARAKPFRASSLSRRRNLSHRHGGGDHSGALGRSSRISARTTRPITETLQAAFFGLFSGKTADKWAGSSPAPTHRKSVAAVS